MTSREIVTRTLNFESPKRVARSFPWDSDFCFATATAETYATDWEEVGVSSWERFDEWGNTWARIDPTSKGEVVKGVLDDIKASEGYEFPDYSKVSDYAVVTETRNSNPDKWIVGEMPGFTFNVARKMRKLEQYLMELLSEEERMRELHDRIDKVLEDMIRNYAASGADCVFFPEDWGTQLNTFISPQLWRREFFPRFENLCGIAHALDIKVFMHSCGMIESIVPGLLEAGIDVLQFDQPDLHGIDTLAAYQEKQKITFWCPVDIQQTLQTRDEGVIRAKVREMLDKLWQGRGGFIAGFYDDNPSIGLEPKWQEIASDEYDQAGVPGRYV
jgi:uroporphyrinogen decarboxylase